MTFRCDVPKPKPKPKPTIDESFQLGQTIYPSRVFAERLLLLRACEQLNDQGRLLDTKNVSLCYWYDEHADLTISDIYKHINTLKRSGESVPQLITLVIDNYSRR